MGGNGDLCSVAPRRSTWSMARSSHAVRDGARPVRRNPQGRRRSSRTAGVRCGALVRRRWGNPVVRVRSDTVRTMSDSETKGETKKGAAAKTPPVTLELAGHRVEVTSPDKVFFDERGDTKLDLVRYYLDVEAPIMASMGGRPVLLQ